MYPLSDKDLDRLSREAAEQQDMEQSQSGWEKLEKRLDKELPQQKPSDRKRFLWFLFLLVLLTGGSLFWMLENKNENKLAIQRPAENSAPNNNKNPDVSTSDTRTATNNSNEKNNDVSKNELKKENSKVSPATQPDDQTTDNPETLINKKTSAKYNNHARGNKWASVANQRKSKGNLPLEKKQAEQGIINGKEEEIVIKKEDKKNDDTRTLVAPAATDKKDDGLTKNISDDPSDNKKAVAESNKEKLEKKKQSIPNSQWDARRPLAFGLIVGLDKSTIHSSDNGKLGYNIGLQVEYKISKRFSLNTGLILTRKNYSAASKDYHPPNHYWTNYVDLKYLDGYCQMWDIPLNVRYNITAIQKNQWFLNTGLSTYIMKKQTYTYYYIYNNATGVRDWKYGSQQNHWLSVLNISGGYERRINPSISLQAEPFVKIPLHGVGFGKMDITSYGMYISLKYSPVISKNKKTTALKNP